MNILKEKIMLVNYSGIYMMLLFILVFMDIFFFMNIDEIIVEN